MPKICILHYGVYEGPGYDRNYQIAFELAHIGHIVHLLTAQNGTLKFAVDTFKTQNLTVYIFPDTIPRYLLSRGYGIYSIAKKLQFLSHQKYDIIQTDQVYRPASHLPFLFSVINRNALVISEWWDLVGTGGFLTQRTQRYRNTMGRYDDYAERNFRKQYDGVVTLSEYLKTHAIEKKIHNRNNILVLNGGANTRGIKFYQEKHSKFSAAGNDEIVFGFIGINDNEIMDLVNFVKAFNTLKDQYCIKWFTIGGHLSEQIKADLDLGDEYIEYGWIEHEIYSKILATADYFILPLKKNKINEARWPHKLGDYFAAGRPTIVTIVGEIEKYAQKYPDLFITTKSTVSELVITLKKCILECDQYIAKRGTIRAIAETKLSWSQKVTELDMFYTRLLKNHNNS